MPIPRDPKRDRDELIARYRIDLQRGLAAPEFWAEDPDVPDDLRELPPRGDPRLMEDSGHAHPTAEEVADHRAKDGRYQDVQRRRGEYLRERFGS